MVSRKLSPLLTAVVVLWAGEQIDDTWTWSRLATFGSVALDQARVHQGDTLLCQVLKAALPREVLAYDQTVFLCLADGVLPPVRGRTP